MKRYKPNRRSDRSYFKRTASRTRKMNLYPTVMRGGIRL